MRERNLFLVILLIALGGFYIFTQDVHSPTTPPAPSPPAQPTLVLQTVAEQIVKPRPYGSQGNQQVQIYLETELQRLKLMVKKQPFTYYDGKACNNIIGIHPGQSPKTIIIGSHFDSVSNTPGADDNASGCIVNLLLAESLSQKKLNHTIRHVFFDCEEQGLVGSRHYAKKMTETCVFMINLDMIGHLTRSVRQSPDASLSRLFKAYPWAKAISYRNDTSPIGRGSDQASFTPLGIQCLWVFTGLHERYHRPTDTLETLNLQGMESIRQYLRDLILDFDRQGKVQGIETLRPVGDYMP